MIDPEKLVKLLMLSTSSEDAEALSAIRHANHLLSKSNLIWEHVIKKGNYKKKHRYTPPPPRARQPDPEPPAPPPPPPPPPPPQQEAPKEPPREEPKVAAERLEPRALEEVFNFLMDNEESLTLTAYNFYSSVFEYWNKNNRISLKQEEALCAIYKQALKRKHRA